LADLCVASARLPELAAALAGCSTADAVQDCLQAHAEAPPAGIFAAARSWIAACYASDSVEEILAALQRHGDSAAQLAAKEIDGKSPSSLKMTLRALRTAPGLGSLEACLEQEYRLALACMASHDFREGVRAAVVDKDRNPAWSPATLAQVTPAMVESWFAAPDFGGLGLVGPE
jgi:enoyl-CoA hydratase